jgi:hypothetical protein
MKEINSTQIKTRQKRRRRSKKINTLARENSSSVIIVLEAVAVEEGEAWLESAALVKNTSLTLWGCLGLNFGGEKECTERKLQHLLLFLLLQNLPNWTS